MTKTIVVIGAGYFGVSCANRLSRASKDFKVKLITKSDYTYFMVAAPRVPVENDTKGTIFPLSQVVDKTIDIVYDEVSLIKENSVDLVEGGELVFDALVIATGAKWPEPFSYTHQIGNDYNALFQKEHDKIEAAKHIVLIGGGYNNAEFAGELHDRYKSQLKKGTKKITVIHSGKYMLPTDGFYAEKLRKRVTEFYQKETDIELILNTKATFSDEDPNHVLIGDRTIEADLIYHSTGVTASIPPNTFTDFTDKDGFIKVHETFQCVALPKGNVFAIGDVADFKYKGLVLRLEWAAVLLANVQKILENPSVTKSQLKTIARPTYHVPTLVSMGADAGCGQVGFAKLPFTLTLPEFICRKQKSKNLWREQSEGFFKNG